AAIREWKTTNGTPSRTQDVAHMGDGASYPVVRFFPRRLRSGRKSSNPRSVPTLTDKIDLQPMPSASRASDLRISPPSRGSSLPRRGKRTAGF
ncbi:MAG: hypothetical protein NT062_25020, partial [Proteobacteria bacterium]|nr:hypothetical protein [Pseudomonadota bacterium]